MVAVVIYDKKAETYSVPHFTQNRATAIREFEQLVKDRQETLVSQHPDDFSLIEVGVWNPALERLDEKVHPELIGYDFPSWTKLADGGDFRKQEIKQNG